MELFMKETGNLYSLFLVVTRKNNKANGHGILILCDGDIYNG